MPKCDWINRRAKESFLGPNTRRNTRKERKYKKWHGK